VEGQPWTAAGIAGFHGGVALVGLVATSWSTAAAQNRAASAASQKVVFMLAREGGVKGERLGLGADGWWV
jgi:hypothetical protein